MRYEVTTGLTPREALEQAIAYFGRGGVGLQAISQAPHSLLFQGGGGHVAITIKPSATTTLELETREWDFAVRRFMEQVSHRPRWWSHWWRRKRSAAPPAPVFTILNNTPEHGANRSSVLHTEGHASYAAAPPEPRGTSRPRRRQSGTEPGH